MMQYDSLTRKDGVWQRANLHSGGLLDWAMHEISIADDDMHERLAVWPTRALVPYDAAHRTIESEGERDDHSSMRDSDDDDEDAGQFEVVPQLPPPLPAQGHQAPNALVPAGLAPAHHSVRKLTHENAVAIYLARLGSKTPKKASRLAAEFGITAKAVRDLWTLRTWGKSTAPFRLLLAHNDYIPPGMLSLASAIAAARVKRALHQAP